MYLMPRCHLPLDVFPSNPRQPTQFRSWFHPIRSCVPQNLLVDRKAPERRSLKNLNPPPIHPYLNSVYVQLSIWSTICIMCLYIYYMYIYIYTHVCVCVCIYIHPSTRESQASGHHGSEVSSRLSKLYSRSSTTCWTCIPKSSVSSQVPHHAILMAVTYGPEILARWPTSRWFTFSNHHFSDLNPVKSRCCLVHSPCFLPQPPTSARPQPGRRSGNPGRPARGQQKQRGQSPMRHLRMSQSGRWGDQNIPGASQDVPSLTMNDG